MAIEIQKSDDIYSVENAISVDILESSSLLEKIKALPQVIQLNGIMYSGRADLASYDAYNRTDLWWVVCLYNEIINPLDFEKDYIYLPAYDSVIELLKENIV